MTVEERVAKVEGILEQMDKRLNHIESALHDLARDKVDKWEARIWNGLIIAILIVVLTVLIR